MTTFCHALKGKIIFFTLSFVISLFVVSHLRAHLTGLTSDDSIKHTTTTRGYES